MISEHRIQMPLSDGAIGEAQIYITGIGLPPPSLPLFIIGKTGSFFWSLLDRLSGRLGVQVNVAALCRWYKFLIGRRCEVAS
jgi:hypothetical protein